MSNERVRKQEFLFLIFDQIRSQFLVDVKAIIDIIDISTEILSTGTKSEFAMYLFQAGQWRRRIPKGLKLLELRRKDRLLLCLGAQRLEIFPTQLIYQGKTSSKSFPSIEFPSDWHITITENYWTNEEMMVDYFKKTLFPFINRKRQELKLALYYPALVIFERF